MNLKKAKIISTIGIIIFTFIFHSLYSWIPNTVFAIFFPVNESIWEHMKLLFTSIILYGIIDYIILVKLKIKFNNFFNSLFISAIAVIPIFLIVYLPIYYKIGPKMFLNIIVMIFAIIMSQIISYYILNKRNYEIGNKICFILIIVFYIVFAYLTYYPIKCELFFDSSEEKYGLNNYNI